MLNGTTHFMPSFATVAFKSGEQLLKKSAFPDEMTCIETKKSRSLSIRIMLEIFVLYSDSQSNCRKVVKNFRLS